MVEQIVLPFGQTPKRRYGKLKYNELGHKWCPGCQAYKPLEQFGKIKRTVDGFKPYCRPCEAAIARKRYRKNPTLNRENVKRSRLRNLEAAKVRRKASYEANKEKEAEAHRRYYQANRDKLNMRGRRRRARLRGAGGEVTYAQWCEIKARYNFTCLCCGRTEPEIKLTLDHVTPLSRGGLHIPENIQPLCKSCNSHKKDKVQDYRKSGLN